MSVEDMATGIWDLIGYCSVCPVKCKNGNIHSGKCKKKIIVWWTLDLREEIF